MGGDYDIRPFEKVNLGDGGCVNFNEDILQSDLIKFKEV